MADNEAVGIEKVGNILLIPVQYAFNGELIIRDLEYPNQFRTEPHFNYTDHFTLKMSAAVVAAPVSLVLGSIVKGIAYLSHDVREKHDAFVAWQASPEIRTHLDRYRLLGMAVDEILEPIQKEFYQRRPGDENYMNYEKEALKDIIQVLRKHKIIFWVDCGTCLGAYRYGGIIPWDNDIDLAILQEDFDNAKQALNELDPKKYSVQDWSGRDKPKSYLKVYDRQGGTLIDIYNFKIDPETRSVCVILSNENSIFLPESWKIRERRYVLSTPFDMIFPLRKASFDGVEVFVPNLTKKYLQMRYGENLDPVKVYNPKTDRYEKDLSHPNWQLPYAR